jgi:hypothetical protein
MEESFAMARIREYFTRGRLAAIKPTPDGWEFQLTDSPKLPKEGRFWIEVTHPYFEQFRTLLLLIDQGAAVEIAVKASAPISPEKPAVVECIRAFAPPR